MNINADHIEKMNREEDNTSPTPSSSTNGDDSSESRTVVPLTLRSIENSLQIPKTIDQHEIQELIEKCKEMVLESAECSEERKWLVRRLIELRLRVQELRETSIEKAVETCVVLGHHFKPQKLYITTSSPVYCDHCSAGIWTMLQSWYMCNDCGYSCHMKCMSNIRRVCVHVIASEAGGYKYTKDICPEKGLSAQAYRCAECNSKITFTVSRGLFFSCFASPFKFAEGGWIEPRLCDYSGLYYCYRCHWNSSITIPARVIRNWDMEPKRVSRAAHQLLNLLQSKPVLLLEELNEKLFSLIPDLALIKRHREEMQMMKQYLIVCPEANNQGLPWKTGLRKHMIESCGHYSIQDLIDLQNGALQIELQSAYDIMRNHITETCNLCKARGHHCELCGNNEIIYPWDTTALMCNVCSTVYHRKCKSKQNHCCPKCLRREKRQLTPNKVQ
ncbi:differentially expressed in FDCP 8 homolog isoform X1 [Trichogramma pretiosum]|uniref:differentially expressed in FDCP 8 homolog isoform X1 n=1 Tax=Trichogramma pretiosum TaxID=7493 RepID=UPI0006C94C38|nr:differentially expressed in FDCP 8 homolog isoform X1 [Trichogramma pretiosum]